MYTVDRAIKVKSFLVRNEVVTGPLDNICRIYTRSRFLSTLPKEAVCNVYYSCPQYSMAQMVNPVNKKTFLSIG